MTLTYVEAQHPKGVLIRSDIADQCQSTHYQHPVKKVFVTSAGAVEVAHAFESRSWEYRVVFRGADIKAFGEYGAEFYVPKNDTALS